LVTSQSSNRRLTRCFCLRAPACRSFAVQCYFPYSIPEPTGGRKKVLNAVKFNSKTGDEDAEFASLDLVDEVVLLGRAQSRLATAVGS
jgi:hypothetical protein